MTGICRHLWMLLVIIGALLPVEANFYSSSVSDGNDRIKQTKDDRKTVELTQREIKEMALTKQRFFMLYNMIQQLNQTMKQNMENVKEMNNHIEEMRTLYSPMTLKHSGGSRTKAKLLQYLHDVSNSTTLSGLFVELNGTNRDKGVETIPNIAGVYPAVLGKLMPSYLANATQWNTFVYEVIADWNKGSLVRIVWYWSGDHPLRNIQSFADSINDVDTEIRWKSLITDGDNLNKLWKEKLDFIAPYLLQLQTAGVIAIFDILPYINYKYYIWRGRPGVNGTAKLYQITHDYLTKQHNLHSLVWTWSLHCKYMTQIEDFWPGTNYVDVASVYVWKNNRLSTSDYKKFINVVGDKPISLENTFTVPPPQLLANQPRWTWFTARADYLDNAEWNNASDIRTTFFSTSVINRGSISFFEETL